MKKLTALAAISAIALSGCSVIDNIENAEEIKQLDPMPGGMYTITLSRSWVEQEVKIREQARELAVEYCAVTERGMQPVQATSDRAGTTHKGATVYYTFRCVGFMKPPADANIYRRLGFYTSEEGRKQAQEEFEREMAEGGWH